jgi:hypothetical protein
MSRPTRIAIWTVGIIFALSSFLWLLPSLIGSLMAILLVFATLDYSSRQYRNAVRTFNSAVRAVCKHQGAIGKVAIAFSRSGPLSGPCYEYARRLMMGEDAIEAAAMARVPLQLRTAIALMSAEPAEPNPGSDARRAETELAMVDTTTMPVYGQFIYLTATAMVTCSVLGFMGAFIVPTMEMMATEFNASENHFRWLMSTAPAIWILFILGLVAMIIVPILNRGHLLGIRLPRLIPRMPRLAEREGEMLHGLADAMDAGWPLGRGLAVGHTISMHSYERRSLDRAMQLIERGVDPAKAIQRTGWIDAGEAAWLSGAPPQRTAELMRTIADQNIRDARSNLRWMMAVFFPTLILLLGIAVLAYAYGFFSTLVELINGLA